MTKKINQTAKLRVIIDGITLTTTAKLLRTGGGSHCICQAWADFEEAYIKYGYIGRSTTYTDVSSQRRVNIQIDIV